MQSPCPPYESAGRPLRFWRVIPRSSRRNRPTDAKEEIYGESEPAEYVYQVVRGAVRTYKLLNDGRRQIGAFHLPGDVFGLESGAEHRLTAEAIIETTVRVVKRRAVEAAAKSDAPIACELWTLTSGDLRHAEDHMLLLGRKTAAERVATFLLETDRRLSVAGMLSLPMCRRDIADYLVPESIAPSACPT